MGSRIAFGVALLAAGLALGAIGYQRSQPTTAESIAGGVAGFAAAVAPAGNAELQKAANDIKNAAFRRGLPFYVLGGAAAAAGLAVLVVAGKGSRTA